MEALDSMTRKELIHYGGVWGYKFTSRQSKKEILGTLKWALNFIKLNNPEAYENMINKVSQG